MNRRRRGLVNIVGIIPARGGSRRLPEKNVRLLAGKPLIAHTIESAQRSKYLRRIVVSTDDDAIARVAATYNAEVIRRPRHLATNRAQTADVALHALELLAEEPYRVDAVVLLQPTSPLRSAVDIDHAVALFMQQRCDALISVSEIKHAPARLFAVERGYLKSVKVSAGARRTLRTLVVPNGAIYIATPQRLIESRSFYGGRMLPYLMPTGRSVDIDDAADLHLAELLVRHT